MVLRLDSDSLCEFFTRSSQRVRWTQEAGCIHCFVKLLLSECFVAFSFEGVRHDYRLVCLMICFQYV